LWQIGGAACRRGHGPPPGRFQPPNPRGGWDRLRPESDIAEALKAGCFMDLIRFRSGKGEKPADGYVFDARYMSGGKGLLKAFFNATRQQGCRPSAAGSWRGRGPCRQRPLVP
jgi:hypothetical protein